MNLSKLSFSKPFKIIEIKVYMCVFRICILCENFLKSCMLFYTSGSSLLGAYQIGVLHVFQEKEKGREFCIALYMKKRPFCKVNCVCKLVKLTLALLSASTSQFRGLLDKAIALNL